MDLKDTITKWHTSLCMVAEEGNLNEAVTMLLNIRTPSAKIFHNVGCIKMRQGLYSDAIQFFSNAVDRDKYLALSYFQRGVCYHGTQRYDRAELDFLTAQSMCPKDGINYRQLGADFVLMSDFLGECLRVTRETASRRNYGQLPDFDSDGCLFWPPKKMVENLVKQDFLGKAKVISSTAEEDIVYATDKMPSSTVVPRKSRHSATSASLHKKVVRTSGGTEIVVPPRPNRPPPALPPSSETSTLNRSIGFELKREKSKSAEDILDAGESQGYSLAGSVFGSGSGCRLNTKSDLASVLLHGMKPGQTQTLPGRRSPKAATGIHGNQVLQTKQQLPSNHSPKHPRPSKPQGPFIPTQTSPEIKLDEAVGKRTVRELASGFSQSLAFTRTTQVSDGGVKPSKPPRPPPPPQRIKH